MSKTTQMTDAEVLQVLLDISKELYLSRTFEEIGKILFSNLHRLKQQKEPTGKLIIYDSATKTLKTVYKHEFTHFAPVPDEISINEIKYFSKIAIDTKQTLFIESSLSDYSLSIDPRLKQNPASSLVFIPLYFDDNLVGIFSYASQPASSINKKFVSVLETIAKIISIVIRQIQDTNRSREIERQNETMSRELLNSTNEYALLLDCDGKILYANNESEKFFGQDLKLIIGNLFWDIIPAEVSHQQKTLFNEVISKMIPIKSQNTFGGRYYNQKIYPIQDDSGKLIHVAIFTTDITEQKESQRELSVFFSNLPGLAFRCKNDKSWTMDFLSQGCYNLTGYKPEELLNNTKLSYNDIIHPDDRERIWEEVQRLVFPKSNYEIIYRIITKENRVKWVTESGSGIFDEQQNLLSIEGIIFDSTKKKRAEILRELLFEVSIATPSESSFSDFLKRMYKTINQIIDARNCYVVLYDRNENFLSFPLYEDSVIKSPHQRNFKKGKTEYVIKTGKPFVASDKAMKELVSSGQIEVYNKECKSWIGVPVNVKDKTIGVFALRNYETADCYTTDDFNLIIPIANTISIIYERIQAEEEKKILENRFKAIWEKSADCLRLIDSNGYILLVNDSFCKTVGLSRDELIGKPFSVIYPEDIRSYMMDKLRENISNGKIVRSYQKKATLWNDKVIWVEVSNSVLEFENEPKMVMSIMRDISQEKFLEEQLIQSQKMESIGRLAGGVAHDFNNILTVILGNSEMIKRLSKTEPKIAAYADKVIIASQRGSDISKQLLSFAKLNKQIILPINLNEIIKETLKLLEHSLKKKVEIKKELDYSINKIDADYGNIQQVIMNIIMNAKDALLDKGTITVKTGKIFIDKTNIEKPVELQQGEYVFFSISDTGTGIPENIKKHIFEPFFTTKDNSRGTGLGLAIVYGIIRSHNGFITVDSEPMKGTTFTIFLPISTSKIMNQPIAIDSKLTTGNFENILLVDDEELILEIGKEILSSLSFYPMTANNGIEALKIYEQLHNKISAVIIDQIMPDKNGAEIALLIKNINPKAKIILSSGTSDQAIEDFIKENNLAGFIQKPYKIEELSALLHSVISGEK